jgi:Dolichyl-phosphate-mannose-protein mannosyltransferase
MEMDVSGDALRIPLPQKTTSAGAASWKIALWLGLIGILSRWLLRGRLLYDQESAGLVFAAFRGELPGGIAAAPAGPLYLALGRALLPLVGSPEGAFVAISVAASGLAFVAIYLLGAALLGELAGVLAATLLMSSPLFWFFGTVGLPYASDTLIAIVAAYLCWRLMSGQRRALPPLAAWLALAGGLRPWAALLMLPLAICAAVRAPRSVAPRAAGLAAPLLASGALSLACLLPIGQLAGGLWAAPPDASRDAGDVDLLASLAQLARAAGWGWGLTALPALGALLLWALGAPGFRARRLRPGDQRPWFFAAWAAPWLLFALLARVEAPGQLAIGLPLLLIWSAGALVRFVSAGSRRMATIAATLIILGNAALFLLTPERPLLGYRLPCAATVAYHDRRLAAAIVAIRNFSPAETLILADQWLPIRYYLPHYPLIPYHHPDDAPGDAVDVSPQQRAAARNAAALVWFEPALDTYNTSDSEIELQPMTVGALRILRPLPAEELVVDGAGFGLQGKTPRK